VNGLASAPAESAAAEEEFSDFCYIVSHDLAASFRQISGFTGLLEQDLDAALSAGQRQHMDHIRHGVAHCQAMLEQLLTFSRIQNAALQMQTCDVSLLVDSARLQLGPLLRELGATVVVEDDLGQVRADPNLLIIALKEILDNAAKFHRAGAAPRIAIARADAAGACAIRIADNGIGAPRDPERLFRMFQSENAPPGHPGAGAGLATARRILRRHGGDVRFVEASAGACIELTLPQSDDA
jgi:signal transduction histidine kinase